MMARDIEYRYERTRTQAQADRDDNFMFIRDVLSYVQPRDSQYAHPVFSSQYATECYAACDQDRFGRFSELGAAQHAVLLLGA